MERVVILTNLLAPYRISLWAEMGKRNQLSVILTGGENPHNWDNRSSLIEHHSWCLPLLIRTHFGSRYQNSRILIVHPLMQFKYIFTIFLARFFGWKLVYFYESTAQTSRALDGFKFILKKLIFKIPEIVVTVGARSTKNVQNLEVSDKKIIELFNAIDSERVIKAKPKQVDQSTQAGHKFLYVGQLISRKNIENTILAFKKYRTANDSLTIVGSGYLMDNLMKLTEELDLHEHVTFKGRLNQNDTYVEYFMHDTLIMPSTEEVWGLVAQEALTAGMHVVVSSVSGVCDLIARFDGVHICSTDVNSIGNAMQDCSKNWLNRIKSPEILKYDTKSLAKKFSQVIELLGENPSRSKFLAD